jgi:hypothetical protein
VGVGEGKKKAQEDIFPGLWRSLGVRTSVRTVHAATVGAGNPGTIATTTAGVHEHHCGPVYGAAWMFVKIETTPVEAASPCKIWNSYAAEGTRLTGR